MFQGALLKDVGIDPASKDGGVVLASRDAGRAGTIQKVDQNKVFLSSLKVNVLSD